MTKELFRSVSAIPLGVSRAMFPSAPGPHMMLRGPTVTYAEDDDAGGGGGAQTEGGEGGGEDTLGGGEGDDDLGGGGEDTEGGEDTGSDTAAGGEGDDTLQAGGGEDVVDEAKPKRVPWQTKRIDALTAQKNAATAKAERLERENEALRALKGDGGGEGAAGEGADGTAPKTTPAPGAKLYTEEEANRLADQKAAVRLLSQKADACYDDAAKLDPGFQARLPAMREAVGEVLQARSVEFFEAVTRLDNGGAVLNELTKDLDQFAELLELGPSAMGIELAKMDGRVGKPKERQISRAGAAARPVRPVEGAAGRDRGYDDLSDDEFAAKRSAEREQHRARGA